MTSLRIAFTELQRLTSGRLPKIAILAMILIPTLYGGLYIYANHDPYENLKHVPAALVVLDQGAIGPDGKKIAAGQDVSDELVSSKSFEWHRVSAAEAHSGVSEGRYDFALTIPRDFSSALTSSARFEPRQAQLRMTTNDANSYLSTTIADTVTGRVRDAIAKKVGTEAATNFLLGLSQIRGSLTSAASGADKLHDGITTASKGADKLGSGATKLAGGADKLATGLGTIKEKTDALPAQAQELADGARKVAEGNQRLAGKGDEIASVSTALRSNYSSRRSDLVRTMDEAGVDGPAQQRILTVYDDLGTRLRRADDTVQGAAGDISRLAGGAQQVADGSARLADAAPQLVSGVDQAATGANTLSTGATKLAAGATKLGTGLDRLKSGSADLAEGLHNGVDQIPAVGDGTRKRVATTIGDPVAIDSLSQASAGSYGAGLAPFFLALAAWIGGYVLFLLVRPLSGRAMAANQTPLRVALGGWLTPALLGAAQVTVLLTVTLVGIRIVPENVVGTLAFMLLMSATFIAIVHALNAWLGAAGQFLGLVLMVLQLVSAGGTFPWQTIPHPLYWLHHLLPMSYAIDGLRQLMYGGLSSLVFRDAIVLLLWFLAALALTALAARRQRVWTVSRIKPELSI